jgi:hypothetical protein
MIVKVAAYRNSISYLFRIINVDYHACVGVFELRNWKDIAERVLAEVESLECKRASQDDRDQHQRCVVAARDRIKNSLERIKLLEAEK